VKVLRIGRTSRIMDAVAQACKAFRIERSSVVPLYVGHPVLVRACSPLAISFCVCVCVHA
jgi:hypothetical protein